VKKLSQKTSGNLLESRIPELDGIRAIAIWMVLLVHVITAFPNPQGALTVLPWSMQVALGHGWLGVDLFFMLSGFLITGILLDSRERPHYFRNFYARRFLRIMPLYFTVVLLWALFYHQYGRYLLLSSVFGANLAPLFHVAVPHGPTVLWSLAVEEHFYLLWPAIVLLVDRRKLLWLCLAIFVGCPILRGVFALKGMNPGTIIVLSWFRFDGLATGAAIAIWARSARFNRKAAHLIAGICLVMLCVVTVAGNGHGIFGTKTPVGLAFTYTQAYFAFAIPFVFALVYRGTVWTSILRNPFLQFSGALSYCLYLVHLSIGDGYQVLVANRLHLGPTETVLVRAAVVVLLSFAVAALSRRFLEQPCLALKSRFEAAGKRIEMSDRHPLENDAMIPQLVTQEFVQRESASSSLEA
jgi:peptidoglycan/LPS O-acetylase OafA/YrhL